MKENVVYYIKLSGHWSQVNPDDFVTPCKNLSLKFNLFYKSMGLIIWEIIIILACDIIPSSFLIHGHVKRLVMNPIFTYVSLLLKNEV